MTLNIDNSGLNTDQIQTIQTFVKQYTDGFTVLNKLKSKRVTFYGAARIDQDSDLFNQTFNLAQKLSELGYTIVNGGGPGMMEAATDGAESVNGNTIAITVDISQELPQTNVDKLIATTNFSVRKYLLRDSDVLVFVPGGIGTLDELAEVLVLARYNKIPAKKIFLYNSKFWNFLETWIEDSLINKWHMRYQDYADLFTLIDSPEELISNL